MTTTDDPVRAELDAVAGVSRRAPDTRYTVTGLSFGEATLSRHPSTGRWEWLTLRLSAAAAATTKTPKELSVSFPMEFWLAQGANFGDKDSTLAAGLYALLMEHRLLSRPGLLWGANDGALVEGPAMDALALLRASMVRTLEQAATCPACGGGTGRSLAASTNPIELIQQMLNGQMSRAERMSVLASGYGRRGVVVPTVCDHTPMRVEALHRLCAVFPELALEASQVLLAAPAMDPPRFVLSPQMEKPMLGQWLMQRTRRRYDYDDYGSGYGRGYGYGGGYGRPTRRVSLRRTAGETTLSPALRGALTFATQSWAATGPLESFVAPPEGAADAAPVMGTAAEFIDVAVLWPESVAKAAAPVAATRETTEVAKAKPTAKAKPKTKKAEAAKAEAAKAAPVEAGAAPTPGQELMTTELRTLGYSDAKVKQLLKAGTLERIDFGWYRWKG